METMVVLVSLKEGVSTKDYERWVLESYLPVISELPSIGEWRNHRITGLLGSDALPPYRYVVTLVIRNPERLGRDITTEKMQGLLSDLHDIAEVTQLTAERFV